MNSECPYPHIDARVAEDEFLVTMDHRERASGMREILEGISGVTVRVETLETADYCVNGMLLVERKSAADFATSIIDTRLFRQAARMSRIGGRVLWIIEGTGRDFTETGLSREALQGALISLSLVFRLPVVRAVDPSETSRLMLYAAGQLRRAHGGGGFVSARKPKTLDKRKIHLLRMLPGVGPGRAKRLLEKFGSVEKCLTATTEELASVEGIGAKVAEQIKQVVEEHPAVYNQSGIMDSSTCD